MIRIASSDQQVLKLFSAHSGVETVNLDGADAGGGGGASLCDRLAEADLFLLTDSQAVEIALHCETAYRPTLVVLAGENEPLPRSFAEGMVDDLVILPLRALDVERILRMHEQMQVLHRVEQTSRAVPALVKKIEEDIQLAQKIQRRLIKEKFPPMGGLNVKSKYWCGLKAGGDYFDVFEFPDGNHVGVILSDSSSYSLSTQFIGSLVQFSVHVGQDDLSDPARIVAALHAKLRENMKEKDRFSILYGILNRKTYQFRYVDCGSVFAGLRGANGIQALSQGDNPALTLAKMSIPATKEVALEPGDRMMLLSDGWAESTGTPVPGLMKEFLRDADAQDVLNEMAFRLRREVEKASGDEISPDEGFPMPPQDCSVLIFDLAKNVLRLARG